MEQPINIKGEPNKRIEKRQTFFQHKRGYSPILLEVIDVEQRIHDMDICKVRWHIIGNDQISSSVFMMAARDGAFADFVSTSRAIHLKAVRMIRDIKKSIADQEAAQKAPLERDEVLRVYRNAKRRVLRMINKYQCK